MVAPSFQSFIQIDLPFSIGSKSYVNVKNPKTGRVRQVRFYTPEQYSKIYGGAPTRNIIATQKQIFGFQNGYIYIFKGNQLEPAAKQYFEQSPCRYARWFGWYYGEFASQIHHDENANTAALLPPSDLPTGITPVKLYWSDVGDADGNLADEYVISYAVEKALGRDKQ